MKGKTPQDVVLCGSDYYQDTNTTRHPGDRVVECGLAVHTGDEHREVPGASWRRVVDLRDRVRSSRDREEEDTIEAIRRTLSDAYNKGVAAAHAEYRPAEGSHWQHSLCGFISRSSVGFCHGCYSSTIPGEWHQLYVRVEQ